MSRLAQVMPFGAAREAAAMTDTVLRTEPEPGIALVTLNRPDRLNAMSHELVADLHEVARRRSATTARCGSSC